MPEYTAEQIRVMPAGRELDAAVEWLCKDRLWTESDNYSWESSELYTDEVSKCHLIEVPFWSTDLNLATTLMQDGWSLTKRGDLYDCRPDGEYIGCESSLPAVAICRARCIWKLTEGE